MIYELCVTNCMTTCRCENGDLTGKHGELTISPLGASRNTYAFIDSNLQLDQTYKSKTNRVALVTLCHHFYVYI